jgi:hypothetical protein
MRNRGFSQAHQPQVMSFDYSFPLPTPAPAALTPFTDQNTVELVDLDVE